MSTEPYEYYHPEIHDDPSEFGEKLINLINEDWNIFAYDMVGIGTDETLLFDILNNNKPLEPGGYIDPLNLYSRITESFTFVHPLEGWEEGWASFKEELKHTNRFFPSTKNDVLNESFNDVLKYRTTYLTKGLNLYRARLGKQAIDKMKAPPVYLAKSGRANPHGISYLYCATDEPTCVAEIRPWKGANITVTELNLNTELKIVNLLKGQLCPFLFQSPFKVL
ncbi:hypothetical protein JCM9152_4381 [Halalkalibacter hemicellulosilyticusJCM 9152]|uniref:RES domain-containing protein n=1 Tax=Halalkalibacter hemicellulosilyticusJCM 9152 TaxID=1236971 RepID=W4QLN2_9BACI|nr:hypothetical protein JCM9152_4381 [Halalkalibacter hemicellulosilyticusJCM 9152]